VAALAALCAASPAAAKALPLLGHHGRWLTDPQGRVVILHGAQIDRSPYAAKINRVDISDENVRFMGAQGFNVARVSLLYSSVEPQLGRFDQGYLDSHLDLDRRLAAAGIYDLLELHQGQYGPVVNGGGFPDWMTDTSGMPNTYEPYARGYIDNPAQNAAWDNFWRNAPAADGVGFQDHFAAGLRHISERFSRAPGLLGIEILNEPWPGSLWALCASPFGCPPGGFDQTALTAFYRRTVRAIRAADPKHAIVYEPNLLFDFGAQTQVGAIGDDNVVFAFHPYCLGRAPGLTSFPDPIGACGINDEFVFANVAAYAARSGHALLMDEWGNDTDRAFNDRVAAEADRHMLGWSYWSYEDCCNSPAAIVKDPAQPPTAPGNLRRDILDALVRAYPQAIAGTPTSWSYDPKAERFALAYSTKRVAGGTFADGAVTQIEVPPLHYPTGYDVAINGGTVVSAPDADPLLVRATTGADRVALTVTPAAHHPAPAGIPGRCVDPPRRVRIAATRAHVVRSKITVAGQRVKTVRGRYARRPRLPAGLTNGTVVRIDARTSRGRHITVAGRMADCRFARD